MSRPQNPRPSLAEEDPQSDNDMQVALSGQEDIEEYDTSSISTCSSSPSSPSLPSSSFFTMISSKSVKGSIGTPKSNHSPPSGNFSPSSLLSKPHNQSVQGSPRQSEMHPFNSEALPEISPCLCIQIEEKVEELVQFLLQKYRMMELTTTEEMLYSVVRNGMDHYNLIFSTACQYMLVIFGIEVKKVYPCTHSFYLVPVLGVTYDGLQGDNKGTPKTGLLMWVLTIIYKKGSPTSEKVVWNVLNSIDVFDSYSYLYKHAWKLITEDFVQEGYLVYRRVPHSVPARFEFLWGPRAHAEINTTEFLTHFNYISNIEDSCYPCGHPRP
uniref:melanoma-associated antigen 10-like n=1 Tax=Jaculus jaculus TaxID=51337 RepID=UPI0003330B76|nr:melanoma-associated antigen 10-like [Jaculus jaculus]